jgi:hypothetical protein
MKKTITSIIVMASFVFSAVNVAVIETEIDAGSAAAKEIEPAELRYITQEIRRQATNSLPKPKYSIMTEQSVQAQGDAVLQECAEENCMVSLGEKIGADFITRGTLSKFRKRYTLAVEIYDTKNGMLVVSSDPVESEDLDDLLSGFRKIAPALFKKLDGGSGRSSAVASEATSTAKKATSDDGEKGGNRWVLVAGAGLPSFSLRGSNVGNLSGDLAWEAGLIYIWGIAPNISLEAGILYSMWFGSGDGADLTVSGVDIPVMFRYDFGAPYIGAGLKIGIPMSGEIAESSSGGGNGDCYYDPYIGEYLCDGYGSGGSNSADLGEYLKAPEISLIIGGGYTFGSLQLAAKYFLPMTSFLDMKEMGAEISRSGLFLEVGILF